MNPSQPGHVRFKRLLGRAWRALPASASRRVVLIYHSIDAGPLSLPRPAFEEQLDWLQRHARVVSLEALISPKDANTAGLQVALTFDDGYESVMRVAAPLLSARAMPATAFLTTACVRRDERAHSVVASGHYPDELFLRWDEVRTLRRMGWSIALRRCRRMVDGCFMA